MTEMFTLLFETIVPLSVALFCGMIIGVERELAHKPAGFRTQSLITHGSTMFVLAALKFGVEPIRIAANVVTGLGFLGAGVILQHRGAIRGMTTSALIWVNGRIGVAIGLGQYLLAALGLIFAIIALRVLGLFEKMMKTKCQIAHYVVATDGNEVATKLIREALEGSHYEEGFSFSRDKEKLILRFGFCNDPSAHRELVEKLRLRPDVLSIEQV